MHIGAAAALTATLDISRGLYTYTTETQSPTLVTGKTPLEREETWSRTGRVWGMGQSDRGGATLVRSR